MRQTGFFSAKSRLRSTMLAFAVLMTVASCESDPAEEGRNGTDELSFNVEVPRGWTGGTASSKSDPGVVSHSAGGNPISRGLPVESAEALKADGFGLSAVCYTGTWPGEEQENDWTTNFAHNRKVLFQENEWKTPERLTWPGSGNIRFFAYYPHSGDSEGCITHSATGTKGIPTLTYTVPDDVTQQPDILFATADVKGDGTGGDVGLEFSHALTAVTVKVGENMPAGKIESIVLEGVCGKGTYAIGASSWSTDASSKKSFQISLPEISMQPGNGVLTGERTLMMIPQALPEGAKLTINFREDGSDTQRSLSADLKDTSWPMGKRVTYTLTSPAIEIEVDGETSVAPWSDGGTGNPETVTIIYEPGDLKMGDYYFSDGSVSDGGLRKLIRTFGADNNVTETMEWESPKPQPDPPTGQEWIGVVFHVGRHGSDKSDYSKPLYEGASQQLEGKVHGYVVALQDAGDGVECIWGPHGTKAIGCIVEKPEGKDTPLDLTTADMDWNGYSWTDKIINAAGGKDNLNANVTTGYPATYYALNYGVVAPPKSSGWFLPATGQMWRINEKRSYLFAPAGSDLNSSGWNLNFGQDNNLKRNWYWSSTETSSERYHQADVVVTNSSSLPVVGKEKEGANGKSLVRPVLVF